MTSCFFFVRGGGGGGEGGGESGSIISNKLYVLHMYQVVSTNC